MRQPTPGEMGPAIASQRSAFEVHEWGVVDALPTGGVEVAAGPGRPVASRPMTVRKPVLYFHLEPGAPPIEVEVRARIPQGAVLEHWPDAALWPSTRLEAESVTWPALRLAPCVGQPSRPPMGRPCSAPDGYCEVNDLAAYETRDASCVGPEGAQSRLLFYRGVVGAPSLPIALERDASGGWAGRATVPGGDGLWLVRGARGARLPWPEPGETVSLTAAFHEALDADALAESLASSLRGAGLTPEEVAAFMRAWRDALFGSTLAAPPALRDPSERGAHASSGPPLTLLYLMPEPTVSALAELTITPAPRTLRRVMLVRRPLE